jgi:hypothetical protein
MNTSSRGPSDVTASDRHRWVRGTVADNGHRGSLRMTKFNPHTRSQSTAGAVDQSTYSNYYLRIRLRTSTYVETPLGVLRWCLMTINLRTPLIHQAVA